MALEIAVQLAVIARVGRAIFPKHTFLMTVNTLSDPKGLANIQTESHQTMMVPP